MDKKSWNTVMIAENLKDNKLAYRNISQFLHFDEELLTSINQMIKWFSLFLSANSSVLPIHFVFMFTCLPCLPTCIYVF